ncbi:carboxypeptidase regulatory-like domain-containing protein [Deinococcus deserti]|uniref:Alpha-galactosidase NEW3 domain-containing protein n=1 Tax=Deinococcus deserti (strain DSM 17065 / CIP 109153 / LMG 22923 / VCD115) TaxID=546414 RepID=C1D2T8_DEIDV|nr:carboxypeptidase regulatory-like domain-containing protein [Deinococcus deserti]ACO47727.2 Hypothetical protein Deide_2p00670 [Deinococcus deserti VCD115]
MFGRRATFVLALTLGLLPSATAQVQLSAAAADVTERHTATLVVRLVNPDLQPREVQLQLALPAGWDALVPARTLTLASGEETVEVIVVRVPRSAPGGTHMVTVTGAGVRMVATVRVPTREALHVRTLSATAANGQAEATFQVRNDGNAPARVNLSAVGQGKPRVVPEVLDLAPGEVSDVQVSGLVPSGLEKYSVTLRARTPGAAAEGSAITDVLWPAPAAGSAWHTLPAEVQIEGGHAGPQVRFSAAGALTPDLFVRLRIEPRTVEAELRAPGTRLLLGPATPGFSSFTVRPPTLALQGEASRLGPGVLRGYVGARRDLPGERVAGLEYGGRFAWGHARVAVDLGADGVTTTLATRMATPQLSAQGELGLRGDGIAFTVDADAALKDNVLNLQRAGADVRYRAPGFDGSPSGRVAVGLRTQAQMNAFSVGAHLRGGVNLAEGYAITARDAEFAVQARDSRTDLRAGLKWSEQFTDQKTTVTASVSSGHRFGWGELRQELTSEQAVEAGTRVTNELRYAAGLDAAFSSDGNAFTLKPKADVTFDLLGGTRRVGASLEGSWRAPGGTQVSATVRQPDFAQRGLNLNAAVEQPLAGGSTLNASLSKTFGPTPSTQVRVTARIPLNLPLYVRRDMGGLEGRVLDQQGRGIAGMTVQVMSYLAVTDSNGTYRFPALPQGDQLVLLRSDSGQWCTPPHTVPVQGRQVVRRDLTCVPAVLTTARLLVYVLGEDGSTPLELPGVLVSLEGSLGRFEAVSDRSGRLSFGPLPTGAYRVSVTPATPVQFRGLTPELPATIKIATGPADLILRFARRPRVIHMQDERPVVVPGPAVPLPSSPATGNLGAP